MAAPLLLPLLLLLTPSLLGAAEEQYPRLEVTRFDDRCRAAVACSAPHVPSVRATLFCPGFLIPCRLEPPPGGLDPSGPSLFATERGAVVCSTLTRSTRVAAPKICPHGFTPQNALEIFCGATLVAACIALMIVTAQRSRAMAPRAFPGGPIVMV